jgi:hypothetical protein
MTFCRAANGSLPLIEITASADHNIGSSFPPVMRPFAEPSNIRNL